MKLLKICFSIVLVFFAVVSCAQAKTIDIIIAADSHYSVPSSGLMNDEKSKSAIVLKYFVKRANEQKPDYVVFLGDNIDKSKPEYLKGFLKEIAPLKPHHHIVLGNRDSYKYSGMSRDEYSKVLETDSKFKKYNSNYVFHPSSDITALVVDSTSLGMPGSHGYFTKDTLEWLDKELTKNADKKVIIFQHVPMIQPEENPSHNILNFRDYKNVIDKHNNILMIVSGHCHIYSVMQDEKGVYHISSPALFQYPYEYMKLQITYDKKPLQKASNFKINTSKKNAI